MMHDDEHHLCSRDELRAALFNARYERLKCGVRLAKERRLTDAAPFFLEILDFGIRDGLEVYAIALLAFTLHEIGQEEVDASDPSRVFSLAETALSRFDEMCSFLCEVFGDDVRQYDARIREWNEKLHIYVGESLFEMKQYEEGIWKLTEAIEASPSSIRAFCQRAMSFSALGRFDDALLDLDAAATITKESYEELSEYSRTGISGIPVFRSMVLAGIDHLSGRGSFHDRYRERVAQERVKVRNDGLVSWKTRPAVKRMNEGSADTLEFHERELVGQVEEFLTMFRMSMNEGSTETNQHLFRRSLISELAQHRTRLDAVMESYFSMSVDDDYVSMRALHYSDAFKSLSFASDFSISTVRQIGLTSESLLSLSSPSSAVVCYHLIAEDSEGESEAMIIRWLIVDGSIVFFDRVICSDVIQDQSLFSVVSFLANLMRRESSDDDMEEGISATAPLQRSNCRLLYDLLLDGLESHLPSSTTHVTFVPDGVLFRVPFGCLLSSHDDLYLIEKYSFSVSCSLWMMKRLIELGSISKKHQIQAVVCEASSTRVTPPSRFIQGRQHFPTEASTVVRFLQSHFPLICLNDCSFTPSLVSRVCSDCCPRYIHIIAHGRASDPTTVQKSFSSDVLYEFDMKGSLRCTHGRLLARSIASSFDLTGTDLVYLSSCSMGDGQLSDGGGILGFYRACFVSGCASVVCCLWPVESSISTRVSIRFYQALVNGATCVETKASAITFALRELLQCGVMEEGNRSLRDFPSL